MTIPSEVRGRFYALRSLAIVVMLLGGVAIVTNNFRLNTLGLAGIMVGVWLVRRSNASVRRARGEVVPEWSPVNAVRRVGTLAWMLTGMSLVACVVFYVAVYVDQFYGGKELWPLYAFVGAVFALVATSGYVAMRIFR